MAPEDWRDLRWAAGVGALLALSPLTGSGRRWLSVLLGVVFGGLVFAFRRWQRRRLESDGAPPSWAWPEVPVWAALIATTLAFVPTLIWWYGEATASLWRCVHGLFVPVFAFLLARSKLRGDAHPERPESSAWGFAWLASGFALAVIDAGVRSNYLSAFGLLICLPGLSLLFLGARRTRMLLAPFALMLLALPAPELLGDPFWLTINTSRVAEILLGWIDIPALRHGSTFITRGGIVGVGQNCSGLSAFHAAAALSVLLAMCARSRSRQLALLSIPYPLVLGLNAIRCTAIVAGTHFAGLGFLATAVHGFSGLAVIWPALFLLWCCADHPKLRESLS